MEESKLYDIIFRVLHTVTGVYGLEKIEPVLGFSRDELRPMLLSFQKNSNTLPGLTEEQKQKILKAFETSFVVFDDYDFEGKVWYTREEVKNAYDGLKEIWK